LYGWRLIGRRHLGLVLLVAALGSGVALAPGGSAAPDPPRGPGIPSGQAFPGGPYFLVGCAFSHRNNDDPIMFPEQPGRSHSHTFIGNKSADASSTSASLRAAPTNCDPAVDASPYWVPTLFENRAAVRPLAALVYYVRRTVLAVQPLPAGLKIIAGDADARRAQSPRIASWGCGSINRGRRYPAPLACPDGEFLNMRVEFPNCWNGRTLDSPDHQRHMAYAVNGRCPASHAVPVPTVLLVVLYPNVEPEIQLASGRFSAHADLINAWDQPALEQAAKQLR
jgi:hypothetical protein